MIKKYKKYCDCPFCQTLKKKTCKVCGEILQTINGTINIDTLLAKKTYSAQFKYCIKCDKYIIPKEIKDLYLKELK